MKIIEPSNGILERSERDIRKNHQPFKQSAPDNPLPSLPAFPMEEYNSCSAREDLERKQQIRTLLTSDTLPHKAAVPSRQKTPVKIIALRLLLSVVLIVLFLAWLAEQ